MKKESTEPCITLHLAYLRVQVMDGDMLLADSTHAIEYSFRQYLSRGNIGMDLLILSNTVTRCPLNGEASCFSFGERKDVAWSSQRPVEGIQGQILNDSFHSNQEISLWKALREHCFRRDEVLAR
ncbi:DUF427 domain-containing protein [Billgrantia saliphila]|uniref:DUF427 domain-containing protein n=1 Tax=Billgrantia saliphila TaxID=1848458 RepID=UPI000CE4454A|nr:DUF427 domain-containing protein [Halomonas saliphila]